MSGSATPLPVVLVDLDDVGAPGGGRVPAAAVVVARWQGRPLGAVVHRGPAGPDVGDDGVAERFGPALQRWRLLASLGAVEPLRAGQDPAVGAGAQRTPASAEGAEIVAFVPTGWELDGRWAAALEDAFADPLVMAVRGAALPRRVAPDGIGALRAELRQRTVDGTRAHVRAARPWQADAPLVVRRAFLALALGPDPTAWDGAAARATVPAAVLRAGYQLASEPAASAWRPTERAAPAARPAAAAPVADPAPPTLPAAAAPAAARTGRAAERLPALSVVVPTRGRRELVVRLLRALDAQRYPDARLEIVVCADGDVDGSVTAIRRAGLRRRPFIVELAAPGSRQGNGAGVARNAAAARCEGELLVFLDDDVIPVDDGVLLAHARAAAGGAAAVVGPAVPRLGGETGIHEQRLRNWWARYSTHLAGGGELTFADACTSNLSLPRTAFQAAGGFSRLRAARTGSWATASRWPVYRCAAFRRRPSSMTPTCGCVTACARASRRAPATSPSPEPTRRRSAGCRWPRWTTCRPPPRRWLDAPCACPPCSARSVAAGAAGGGPPGSRRRAAGGGRGAERAGAYRLLVRGGRGRRRATGGATAARRGPAGRPHRGRPRPRLAFVAVAGGGPRRAGGRAEGPDRAGARAAVVGRLAVGPARVPRQDRNAVCL